MELIEMMGKEYAYSFSGQLYYAFESVMNECSVNKFKVLGKKIFNLAPNPMRDMIGHEGVSINGQTVTRWAKEEAWLNMPEIPQATIQEISSTIMWIAPKSGKALLRLWQEDPRQVAWQSLDVFKLLVAIHGISGGWH